MITFKLINKTDINDLLTLGKKTFCDAFQHLNNPDDFNAYFSIAFTSEKLLAEIENPDSVFYFALIANEQVGYIKLNYGAAQTEFGDIDAVEIERIYVLSNHQGAGIGKKLLDFALTKAIENKFKYIWLGVWEHNHNAIRFYEREGFHRFSSHKFALGKDIQTDILMKKELQ
jgi:ribosomal protein S18 acetylase RimI-like enzyme